jgi:uncharacterized protein (TIGR00661 family)
VRYLFFIQGEGRGHFTQAVTMADLLRKNGHEIVGVIIGAPTYRILPEFVQRNLNTEIHRFETPAFQTGKDRKKINWLKTSVYVLQHLNLYKKNLLLIEDWVNKYQPDRILNFYEVLGGIWNGLYNKNKIPVFSIGHQYLSLHPDYKFPQFPLWGKAGLLSLTHLTAWKAQSKLALSFISIPSNAKIKVIPPLLRNAVFQLQPDDHGFVLAYVVNEGYVQDILKWHQQYPEVKMKIFSDFREGKENNIEFYLPQETAFLEALRTCSVLISTAGFESVCEALYLNKPVWVVPVEGQFEQYCNAFEGERLNLFKWLRSWKELPAPQNLIYSNSGKKLQEFLKSNDEDILNYVQ